MLEKKEQGIIAGYFEDHSGLLGGHADRVCIPEHEDEIAEYLREATARRIPVTISGAGTGVTGGRIPFGGEVLSMESMNRIIDIRCNSAGEHVAIVQPGVRVQDLRRALEPMHLAYAPDPTEQSAFIGGNVATNASGSRGFKYGPTRKYVRRLKILLANGKKLELPRGMVFADASGRLRLPLDKGEISVKLPAYELPLIKNAAGYFNRPGMDAIDLFIGQEGTLGVVTEIEIALIDPVERLLGGVAFFKKMEDAWEFVAEARSVSRNVNGYIEALSLEYLDRHGLELLKSDYSLIPGFAQAAILFEQDTTRHDEIRCMERWSALIERHNAPVESVWLATNRKELDALRAFRHRMPEKVNEIVKRNKLPKVGTDVAVPDMHSRSMMQFCYDKFAAFGMEYLVFGHIGESHLHANILPATEKDHIRCRELYAQLVAQAVQFGGTVSAEHGIGKLKHGFLRQMVGARGVEEMAHLKKSLDPACILGGVMPEAIR